MGFFKKIGSALKTAGKGALVGLKYAGQNAEFLSIVGVPPIAIKAIKGAMGVAEARGGKDKAKEAALLAMLLLQDEGVKIPYHKVRMAIELLRDPDIQEGLWDFNLEKSEHLARATGFGPEGSETQMSEEEILAKLEELARFN